MSYIGQAPGLGQRTAFRFVAVAGQTTFSGVDAQGYPLGYTPGLVDIYLNGRLLSEPDVTASDGSTIKIATSLSAGDEVRVLAQAPFSPANTYTMAQADSFQRRRNRIVDPGMRVSQENGSNLLTIAYAYPSDSIFAYHSTGAGSRSVQRIALATPGGSPYRVRYTVTGANANPATGDQSWLNTRIEGIDIADLKFGTSAARTITLRFGCRASVAGTYSVALLGTGSRGWLGSIAISQAEVGQDVVKSVTLVGDQAGTWATDNTLGLSIYVVMCAGSTLQGAAGWQNGGPLTAPGCTNLMATNGATFDLFDVGLYDVTGLAAGVVPPFELDSFDRDLAKCQRYYAKTYQLSDLPGSTNKYYGTIRGTTNSAGTRTSMNWILPVTMRVNPSVTAYGTLTGAVGKVLNEDNGSGVEIGCTIYNNSEKTVSGIDINTAVPSASVYGHFVANARL